MVELVIISEPPEFNIPPPTGPRAVFGVLSPVAELLLIVQRVMVMVPFSLATPPPPSPA